MSLENARDFVRRLANDDVWRAKVREAKSKEERLKLCKEEGYEFDESELGEAESEHGAELSNAELDQVAGGAWIDRGGGDCLLEGCI